MVALRGPSKGARSEALVAAESTPCGPHPEVARALEFTGIFTRIAKQEKVSCGHVVQVAKGNRTSKRVIDAIVREVRRIEQNTERAA